jgi:hypothetical protein
MRDPPPAMFVCSTYLITCQGCKFVCQACCSGFWPLIRQKIAMCRLHDNKKTLVQGMP